MKLLLVLTGGTIGSRVHNSTIDVDYDAGYHLLELYHSKYRNDIDFDVIQPFNILSEKFTPHHWKKLYDTIRQIDLDNYEGVIITHGTDTLPYTSAFLSYTFFHTKIPFIIAGSNYTLEKEESNGLNNFRCSVNFILNSPLPGIYTIFQNNKGKNIVYLGTRVMEADSYNDQFFSFGGIDFGEIKNDVFKRNRNRDNPSIKMIMNPKVQIPYEEMLFENQIFAIRPYPGLDYEFIHFNNKPRAILHSLYHSGTGCISDSGFSLPKFVKKCKAEGIDFYLISFKNIDDDLYRTSREILEYGAYPLQNISFEAAYVKLCIAYNQTLMPPQKYMEEELFFEFINSNKDKRGRTGGYGCNAD